MSRIGVRDALLVAFLVASGAPLLVFWLWPHTAALQIEIDEVRDRHLLHARSISTALEHYDTDVKGIFGTFAPLIATGTDMEFARSLLSELRFRHFCVVDAETGAVKRAFLGDGVTLPDRVPEAQLRVFLDMADRPLGLSSVMPARGDVPPQLLMAAWVEEELVVAAIDTSFFRDLAAEISFGHGGHAAIVDSLGQVVAHPNDSWVAQVRPLADVEPVRRMLNGETGVTTFFSPSLQEDVVAGFAAVNGTGWGVMVPQPLSELHAKAEAVTRQALVVLAVGLVLSAATALIFSAHLAGSIGSVSAAAMRMARGDPDVRVSRRWLRHSLSELSRLGQCFNDMARQVQAAGERVNLLARTDPLTGLSNRAAFLADAQILLEDLTRREREAALFFVDVDRLKAINDGFGHTVGDRLLAQVGQRLAEIAAPDDLVARQGGDEFLLLHVSGDDETPLDFGRRIRAALMQPFHVDQQRLTVTASVGGSVWPRSAADLEDLVRQADQAMYHAKQTGLNDVRMFDAALCCTLAETSSMAQDLALALSRSELEVAYQPILDLDSGRLAAFEALARWNRGDSGPVPPEQFVRLAEQTGLISELGRFVRDRAFRFGAALSAQGTAVPIAVNLSQIELAQQGIAEELTEAVAAAGLRPRDVILEITESATVSLAPSPDAVERLHAVGFVLAIDDFGKGLSSYSRLLAYKVDRLKIDATFAGSLTEDRQAHEVVASLLNLGKSLGLRTTVEGIETAAELDHVLRMGADEVQGFWHRRPMTPPDALRYARDAQPVRRAVQLAG
jgi:diguanylate cyclase (GGDEF)-like protein